MDKKIGFIGLGIMGKPMAMNLIKAGYSLVVYNLVQQAMGSSVVRTGDVGRKHCNEC